MARPPSRTEHAEAVTRPGSSPTCPVCGTPVVRSHSCRSKPVALPMPKDFYEQVEQARRESGAPRPEISPAAAHEPLPLFDEDPDSPTTPDPKEHPMENTVTLAAPPEASRLVEQLLAAALAPQPELAADGHRWSLTCEDPGLVRLWQLDPLTDVWQKVAAARLTFEVLP